MVTLTETFSTIRNVKVLVVGDLILDEYTKGDVDRVSPEAPVPILLVSQIFCLLGGAGNVACNLQALGADVCIVGRVGDDVDGGRLENLLHDNFLSTDGIFVQKDFKTPLKNRFIAAGQQLIRADYEKNTPISEKIEEKLKDFISKEISNYDIIAISDYGKGCISTNIMQYIINEANKYRILVVVDPKGKDITKYSGAFLLKPNQKEAYYATSSESCTPINDVADKIINQLNISYLLITRSKDGMILFDKDGFNENFEVKIKDVLDVTGAGDTVLAMLVFCLANGFTISNAIKLANISASIAIESLGCAIVKLSEVAKSLIDIDPLNKIVGDDNDFFVLKKAIDDNKVAVLYLEEQEELSNDIFCLIKDLDREKGDAKLIIHVDQKKCGTKIVNLLASMREVDFIVTSKEIEKFINHFSPIKVSRISKCLS